MCSAVPDAPLVIVMLVMFVVNRAAAPEEPMTYGITHEKCCPQKVQRAQTGSVGPQTGSLSLMQAPYHPPSTPRPLRSFKQAL